GWLHVAVRREWSWLGAGTVRWPRGSLVVHDGECGAATYRVLQRFLLGLAFRALLEGAHDLVVVESEQARRNLNAVGRLDATLGKDLVLGHFDLRSSACDGGQLHSTSSSSHPHDSVLVPHEARPLPHEARPRPAEGAGD